MSLWGRIFAAGYDTFQARMEAGFFGDIRGGRRRGGRLIFIEHVRAEDPGLAKWQDRLHPLWVRFGHGCHCNRPTLETLEASPLRVESHRRGRIPKAPPIVRPLITGMAVAPHRGAP